MDKSIERLAGDTEGVAYEFPVFRFKGSDGTAPNAYLQAALHAGELPGTVAIDALMPLLAKAESEGRIRGAITVVPWANPVGRAQYQFTEQQGRFHLATRTNFNRDFPLIDRPDVSLLPDELHSPIITSFYSPGDPCFEFATFYDKLKRRRYVIYPGKVTAAATFRIGTIGHLFPADIHDLLGHVGEVLNEMNVSARGPAARQA